MKSKFLFLSVFILSSVTSSFAEGGVIGAGEGGSGGGLGVAKRMLFSFDLPEVSIVDANTGLEVGIVSVQVLDSAIEELTAGEYILIYKDNQGNELERTLILKE